MERFKTKTVVITGAGSGLGRGLALEFAKIGWRVAASDINLQGAEETVRLVNGAGGKGMAVPCDVMKPDEVQSLADAVISEWGTVDIVINNAGVPVVGVMDKITLDDWRFEIDIMLMSVVHGCRSFIPVFRKQGWGHIVNTASAAGIISLPWMAPYNATKAAVIALSETLRAELKTSNIGVTVVCPTFFQTNLLDNARISDDHTRSVAYAIFEKMSFGTTRSVSSAILKAVKKNRLYVVPQPDAKLYWFMKRLMPQTYHTVNGILFGKGIVDRILGV